jgi:hypothetical protein
MSDATAGQLIALGVLFATGAVLLLVGRKVAVALSAVTYTTADGIVHTVDPGATIPPADLPLVSPGSYATKFLPLGRSLIVGTDNRTSTSKTVVLAWTLAVAYGLIAIIVAKWLGSSAGYDSLVDNGLREEYWLFLGGTYASAIIAKYSATTQAQGAAKPSAGVGDANVSQLVTDDTGRTDIGDFQYVLFNAIALAFYLGEFIPHLANGIPHIPAVLTGLALTSAGGYSAKKLFLQQTRPTLTSVIPATISRPSTGESAKQIEVWGQYLILPADVAPGGTALPPKVLIGGQPANVPAFEQTLGSDKLTVEVTSNTAGGAPTKLTAIRADGVPATGPGGTDGLTLTIS